MKSRILTTILACASAGLAHAQFDPVAITQSSYTYAIVVPAGTIQDISDCLNVTAGNGNGKGDNTYFEQGLFSPPGTLGANCGIPLHNTVFTNINNANQTFLMPPDYTVNNDLMVDSVFTSGTLTFNTPATATQLSILSCGGGGALTVNYTVTHTDNTTESGTINLLDWFNGGSTVAWGANGRVTYGGGFNNINTSTVNNQAPYLYANTITVSGTVPVASITFSGATGNHGNIFAVSGSADGTTWTPIPVSGFNVLAIAPAAIPYPVNATIDAGTNLYGGNGMNTFYEQGYDRNASGTGLPLSGTTFTSLTQPSHTYQMGNYATNCAILVDTNHLSSNITPVTPTAYTAISLLTAGGNIGGNNIMTNLCILQHQDGVNETNLFYGYDWFNTQNAGSYALIASGRVNMSGRSLNDVGAVNSPNLFESYFLLNDTTSPITNIVVQYQTAPGANATTYVMAVSASTAGVPPLVTTGPIPTSQTFFPGTNASFTVGVSGTQPLTGYWQVENAGTYYTLSDGLDANGSMISGSHTTTLTISNLFVADGTNYQYVAVNNFGTGTSPAGTLIVSPQAISITPATPVFYGGNNIPLTANLSAGPAVTLQWYYMDVSGSGITNLITGATGTTYTITNATSDLNGYTYGVIASNVYGTNTANVVLSVSDSAAFLGGDLTPTNAEAYVGAPVIYTVNAQGNSPITFQWMTNGIAVSGNNSNSLVLVTPCGNTTIQVAFSNVLNGGTWISSAQATLHGDANPTNLTFAGNGANWQTNGNSAAVNFTGNVLQLTDGNGGEESSAFYNVAQYVGGSWSASYTYNSYGGSADGTVFVIQNSANQFALGGGGGEMGYAGIGNSIGFVLNLYPGNGEIIGAGAVTNGPTAAGLGVYCSPTDPVNVAGTNAINVVLTFDNGVLTASLTDAVTGGNYTASYNYGSLVPILGGNVAYVGFGGGDGGATSTQTVSNFQFHSVLPPVSLGASSANGTVTLSWPVAAANYELQMTTSLTSPSWIAGPAPSVVGGVNQVNVNAASGGQQQFYRLVRVVCQ